MKNNTINFNTLRNMAKKISDTRYVLKHLHIENGTAYFTDSYIIVIMKDYTDVPDANVNLLDYTLLDQNVKYPNLHKIIEVPREKRKLTPEIVDGEVMYQVDDTDKYIRSKTIEDLKKLVTLKKFEIDVNEIVVCENRSTAVIKVNHTTDLLFMLYRKE